MEALQDIVSLMQEHGAQTVGDLPQEQQDRFLIEFARAGVIRCSKCGDTTQAVNDVLICSCGVEGYF